MTTDRPDCLRAGSYAVFRGREHRCGDPHPRTDPGPWWDTFPETVRLFEDARRPRPDWADPEPHGTQWTGQVPRDQVTRLFVVATTAVWTGDPRTGRSPATHEDRVQVRHVDDEAREALVESWSSPVPDHPRVQPTSWVTWEARVPLSELVDVVQDVSDVAV